MKYVSEPPKGFEFQENFISVSEEKKLLDRIKKLEFSEFNFRGFIAKRRTADFGYDYSFESRKLTEAPPIPRFLYALKTKAENFAKIPEGDLTQISIIEYSPGAPIGWHKDVKQFDKIVGVSLLNECIMRLKSENGRFNKVLKPRSIYLLSGDARWKWKHSIPPVKAIRYSITFRSLRKA